MTTPPNDPYGAPQFPPPGGDQPAGSTDPSGGAGFPPPGGEGYPPPGGQGYPPPGGQGYPPAGYGYGPPQKTGTNGFAIASLIMAFLCAPLGLIFGFVAKHQIKTSGQSGNGLATAGIVISILAIAANITLAATGNSIT